ncbi:MAG: alpha/beta hydrolase, partial [Chloroflexota bacterium]
MLSVLSALPSEATSHPPIILVHGAANSAQVWTFWQRQLADHGWTSHAIDLRGHGRSTQADLSHTSMHDYAADIRSLVNQLRQRPVLIGWSMGGLVAMMAAATGDALACVTLAPSVPAQRTDGSIPLRTGEFGPEEYGITSRDPENQPRMPDLDTEERKIALTSLGRESRLARDERRLGIVIEALPCPLLILTGAEDKEWPIERYHGLWLDAEYHQVDGASHWGLVLNRRALAKAVPEVVRWLSINCQA